MRSLCFLLRKMLSEVTPGLQQLNREASPWTFYIAVNSTKQPITLSPPNQGTQ
jgi:hypothetical protein